MDIKEKIKELRRKYGEMVVEIDGEELRFKPTVEFYEGFLIATATEDETKASKEGVKYFIKEFPKIVAKDLEISEKDAKLFVMAYVDKLIEAFVTTLSKKK